MRISGLWLCCWQCLIRLYTSLTSMMSCRVTSEILSIIILSFISRQSVAPYTASVGIISFLYCAGDFPISFLNTLLKYSGFSYPTISEISLML